MRPSIRLVMWKLMPVVGTLLVLAIAVYVSVQIFDSLQSDAARDSFRVEAGKAILNGGMLAALGIVAAFVLKRHEQRRDERRGYQASVQLFARSLSGKYRELKYIRRSLVALTSRSPDEGVPPILLESARPLLEELSATQLDFEELRDESKLLLQDRRSREVIVTSIKSMEDYLHNIVAEHIAMDQCSPSELESTGLDLTWILDFVGPYESSEFRDRFKRRYDTAMRYLRREIQAIGMET